MDLTLGDDLIAPMQPEADPSILPWHVERWGLVWRGGEDLFANASVFLCEGHPEQPEGKPWTTLVFGPGESRLDSWHESAEAARAAVEEHLAAHLEQGLGREVRP